MSNEILSINVPQISEDIDIFEDIRITLKKYNFSYLDMEIEYTTSSIVYRFQRIEDDD